MRADHVSAPLSRERRRQRVGFLLELVASRHDASPLLASGVAGGAARLSKALVDRDPAASKVPDRRLGPRAPSTLSPRRSSAAARGSVPAAKLGFDGGGESRPLVGEVRGERMLGDVESCLQLREPLGDLVGSAAGRRADGCLILLQCVQMTLDRRAGRRAGPARGPLRELPGPADRPARRGGERPAFATAARRASPIPLPFRPRPQRLARRSRRRRAPTPPRGFAREWATRRQTSPCATGCCLPSRCAAAPTGRSPGP